MYSQGTTHSRGNIGPRTEVGAISEITLKPGKSLKGQICLQALKVKFYGQSCRMLLTGLKGVEYTSYHLLLPICHFVFSGGQFQCCEIWYKKIAEVLEDCCLQKALSNQTFYEFRYISEVRHG